MTCKNCAAPQEETQLFCSNCGAKVITKRISVKSLFSDFSRDVLGWDNKYFRTAKDMVMRPEKVILPYLDSTRKRYMSPLAFFSIGTAIALVVFNFFADFYLEIIDQIGHTQASFMENLLGTEQGELDAESAQKRQQRILENEAMQKNIQSSILKYFNIFSFLYLPFYSLLSYWTYRKPHNFGEHLVINAYIQGTLFLSTITLFLFSIAIEKGIFAFNILLYIPFYLYALSRVYEHSFGQAIMKFLRFLLVFLVVAFVFMVIFFLIGLVFAVIYSNFFK